MAESAAARAATGGGALEPALHPVWGALTFDRSMALKLCAGLSLLVILLVWFDVAEVAANLAMMESGYLLLALTTLAGQFALSCARWLLILDRQEIAVPRRDALSMFGIATLANLFLVTSLAGMSVRVALLMRIGASVTDALASVTAERIAAAIGLIGCAAVGFGLGFAELRDEILVNGSWREEALAICAAVGAAVVCAFAIWRFKTLRDFTLRTAMAFRPAGSGLILVLLSAVIVLSGFAGMAVLAMGMDIKIDPLFFVTIMPAIAFVSALPISIGGWGVREGMMVAGLSLFSVEPDSAVALSISYGLAGLLVALVCGVTLAFMGSNARRKS